MSFIRGDRSKLCLLFPLAAIVSVLILAGCQSHPVGPLPSAQVKLGFSLQSSDLASLVSSVTLTIRYPDSVDVRQLTLVNGQIHDTIAVDPADSIVFTLRAFDNKQNLLYIGSETRRVASGQRVEVSILLLPNPELLMLRVGPLFQSTSLVTENLVSVFVDVHNVDSLFGAAFRIKYDTLALGFSQALEDSFVVGDPPVPTIAGVVKDSAGVVAYFVSRVRQTGAPLSGVSGSGRLATFLFTKRSEKSSDITIDRETVSLKKPNGDLVARFTTKLVLESATVEIR